MRWRHISILVYLSGLMFFSHNGMAQKVSSGATSEKCSYASSTIEARSNSTWKAEANWIATQDTLTNVYFLDSLYGWVVSDNMLYRTDDGSKTWQHLKIEVPSDFRIRETIFVTRQRGWVTLERPDYDPQQQQLRLMVTNDGGKTWRQQLELDRAFGGKLLFVNEREGWFATNKYLSPQFYAPLILHTSDGGKTWKEMSGELLKSFPANQKGYRPQLTNIIIEADTATISMLDGRIFSTSDDGRSWHAVNSPCSRSDSNMPFGIKLGTKGNKLLWMAHGADGFEGIWGEIAEQQADNSWIRYGLTNFALIDALHISNAQVFAVGTMIDRNDGRRRGTVLYSTDQGRNWSIVYQTTDVNRVMKLIAVSENLVLAVGEKGLVLQLQSR